MGGYEAEGKAFRNGGLVAEWLHIEFSQPGGAKTKEFEQEVTEETEKENLDRQNFSRGCGYSRRSTGRDDTDF